MWHRALSSIPSKPVLVIAPVLAACVLTYYFWTSRNECMMQSELRQAFTRHVAEAASADGTLVLSEVTGFPWDHVKGFEAFKPEYKKRSCHFGWDWSEEERERIIEAGHLSMLLFFYERNIIAFLELRNDQVSIEEFEQALTPETANFAVSKAGSVYRLDIIR